jgi:tRNA-2-methylthio-N6-dimethylallyladenosine synthase
MPLQAGNDRILKLMNRNYRRQRYLDIIAGLKQRVPDISITTDIIVAFPSETEEEFQDTLSVMREVDFDNSYSFIFSPRPGTKAAELDGLISKEVALDRLHRLQTLQNEIIERRLNYWVGKEVEVLLDGPSQNNPKCLQGRISQNILLNLNQPNEALEPGMLVKVMVSGAAKFTLKGDLVV